MANAVSGFDHFDYYLDIGLPGERKLNSAPIADGVQFTATGLDPATDFSTRITAVPVDKAGNANKPGKNYAGKSVITIDPTPAQSLMSAPNRAAIDTLITRCLGAGAGPGVAVSIRSPFGYYDTSQGPGVGPLLSFRAGSQTKQMLIHTIAQAIDQGLITGWDAHLSDYWDGPIPNKATITLRQMAQMRSGIYDYMGDQNLGFQYYMNPAFAITVDQVIARINAGAALFSPGSSYQYCNSNFVLLGRIREQVDPAGRKMEQILKEDVFAPLGMSDTVLQRGVGASPNPRSTAYGNNFLLSLIGLPLREDKSVQNADLFWTAGAVNSFLADMVKWGDEMRTLSLLSADSKAELRNSWGPPLSAAPYYGIASDGPHEFEYGLGRIRVGSWHGGDGSVLGHSSCTMVEPQTGTIISVYENFQTSAPHPLAALSLVFFEIAEYLLPTSAKQPGYMTGEAASGTSASALKKLSTDSAATVFSPGVFPPVDERNNFKTDAAVPVGATYLRVIKLQGKGGNGGPGTPTYNATGGSGGGSGARIPAAGGDLLIPVTALGSTYTTRINASGDAEFLSGSLRLSAKAGGNGSVTAAYGATMPGGAAGVWEAVGATGLGVTGANGVAGGYSTMGGGVGGGSGVANDVPGSGAGGRGSYGGISGGVQSGGSSLTVTGTTGAGGSAAGDGAGAGGGEGAAGGNYGAGGGGGYSYGNVGGQAGGAGGAALVHIGWE